MAVAFDWVEVHDPHTKHVYYANPTTGECLWEEKPTVGSIKTPHPDGDWWELWDEKNQIPYYYHTQRNTTQWNKPEQESSIISLVKIQQSSPGAQKRLSVKEPPPPPWQQDNSTSKRNSRSLDLEQQNGNIKIVATPQRSTSEETRHHHHHHHHHQHAASTSTTMSNNSTTSSSGGGGGFFGRRARNPPARKSSLKRHSNFFRSRASIETAFANFTRGSKKTQQQQQVSAPINNPEARASMHPLNDNGSMIDTASVLTAPPPPPPNLLAQINNQPVANGESKRMILPTSLQHDINQFAIDGFAQKYFATHKRGLFRRRVPMKEMLEWTKDSLNKPLMMLNKDLHKDALRCFRMIQMVMGDRHRPRNSSDVEDLQSILSCGITKGQMRDEIYVQVCKQLHNNPRGSSIRKGWEILCTVCITFPPSKNLESYLTHFVQQHHQVTENDVNIMSKHVSTKLKWICIRGAKGKVLTAAEIERAKIAPFKPSVFGERLSFIMSMEQQREQQQQGDGDNDNDEKKASSSLQIPRIVPFLADAVIRLNGQQSEGIFRVPGDADDVTELRVRIENGNYDASGITDPNVPASLLKYWIRDLPEPLIPMDLYYTCVACAEDIDQAISIINSLPDINRRIVLYILSFLQEFIDPDVIKHTLMNVHNLAMVYAPNLLRCPSEKLTTVLENSKYEQAFLRCLLLQLDADKAVCAYDTNSDKAIGSKKEKEE